MRERILVPSIDRLHRTHGSTPKYHQSMGLIAPGRSLLGTMSDGDASPDDFGLLYILCILIRTMTIYNVTRVFL